MTGHALARGGAALVLAGAAVLAPLAVKGADPRVAPGRGTTASPKPIPGSRKR